MPTEAAVPGEVILLGPLVKTRSLEYISDTPKRSKRMGHDQPGAIDQRVFWWGTATLAEPVPFPKHTD